MFLVTGGAGFIGSNIVAALEARGAEVAVCDRLGHGDKWRNLANRELADLVAPERLLSGSTAAGSRRSTTWAPSRRRPRPTPT